MTTDVLERTETRPQPTTDTGDHDRFSHVIRKAEQMPGYVLGEEVTALCGKRWVPSHDPQNYPLCPTCREVVEASGREVPA